METTRPTPELNRAHPPSTPLQQSITNALRFWEPRRLLYNFILTIVVLLWVSATWPHFRPALTLPSFLIFAVLAFLANLCYCAAYFVDVPLQLSSLRASWIHRRWTLWLLGTLLALVFENYWIADEIYPFVR
jgi:hypothetical protein